MLRVDAPRGRGAAVNIRVLSPRPAWPEVVRLLATARSHEDEMVIADWLEETGHLRAAEVFRSTGPGGHFWRSALSALAVAHPYVAPTDAVLMMIAARVSAIPDDLDGVDAIRLIDRLAPELDAIPLGS